MSLLFWVAVFIASLVLLIFSADRFTKTSEKIGLILGIPSFIVGVTIVALGTSLPELLTSLIAVFKTSEGVDTTQIVLGNVFGSNIANILLIVGISAIAAKKLEVKRSLIELDIPLLVLTTGVIVLMLLDGQVTWIEGVLLLIGYGIYIKYSLSEHSREEVEVNGGLRKETRKPWWYRLLHREQNKKEEKPKKREAIGKHCLILLVYCVLLYFGARYTIDSLIEISTVLGIATSIIAASAVAVGTSLPELVVSVSAVKRGEHEVAVGNIFGSNIFNIAVVIGIPALITPIVASEVIMTTGITFLIASTFLFVISGISKRIYSFEGAFYLIIYVMFIAKLFGLF